MTPPPGPFPNDRLRSLRSPLFIPFHRQIAFAFKVALGEGLIRFALTISFIFFLSFHFNSLFPTPPPQTCPFLHHPASSPNLPEYVKAPKPKLSSQQQVSRVHPSLECSDVATLTGDYVCADEESCAGRAALRAMKKTGRCPRNTRMDAKLEENVRKGGLPMKSANGHERGI